jgi:hypothetical protein
VSDELETILRRVADGELTAEEAEPLVAAATRTTGADASHGERPRSDSPSSAGRGPGAGTPPSAGGAPGGGAPRRTVRLQVLERGRAVVNLRIPMSWASLAGSVVPGLSGGQADRLREAIRSGEVGPILEVRDDDGDGVIISTE